ncbi:LamG-like jellyroll fold domain-containing protein [Shewanella psychrotolerans]|uniref:LamG-like jellyroll fold domain-containing protein n=1 Tax=Shewanella psychrotolerans TaxID=2864206 RepID=UPI001C65F44F|nr:LamG-like jellyroll fold domain-containing protein [Shewanella psychrotolerans]QYK03053.1 family 43 glycosylhydrolase [Shewanella psychrotolerans]
MKLNKLMLAMVGAIALAGCGSDDGQSGGVPPNPIAEIPQFPDPTINKDLLTFNDLGVHDPSVVKSGDTYYVFGSHLAAAKSIDLMNWSYITRTDNDVERIANDATDQNPLFDTMSTEMADAFEWTGPYFKGSWAADVIQLKDEKYYFYYNWCNNPDNADEAICHHRSFIGVAVADNVEGPYVNKGVFLRSGMTDQDIADGKGPEGVTSYDPATMPNAIDPDVFYDKDGQLWMSYGSYSGGIFILKMDEETAMPLPGQGYGKRLTGGNFHANEGSYVLYSPESDYYYLFTSIGGYDANGGYNIRVSRSVNPDGPYIDAAGNDMSTVYDSPEGFGNKLMGGFEFVAKTGDVGDSYGYLSPGHNSAYYDEKTGKHLLITHTRFPNRDEQHSIRVHEMFVNADGWLIASPQRYAPIDGDNIVDGVDLVGDYRFINLGKDTNKTAKQSVYISLTEDRLVKGAVSGTYLMYENEPNRITLDLGETGIFEGVLAWQWDEQLQKLVPTFSALSDDGVTVWGSQLENKSTSEVLEDIGSSITIPSEIKGGIISLPTEATRGATITWSSSNDAVIRPDGKVLRPNAGEGDQVVTLTATIMVNGEQVVKTYQVTVLARQIYNRIANYRFDNSLEDSLGLFDDGQPTGDRLFKTADNIEYAIGFDGQALSLDGAHGVLLPSGLISSNEYTVSFWANPTVNTKYTTAFFGAVDEYDVDESDDKTSDNWISFVPQSWDDNTMLWSNNTRDGVWFDGSAEERIPENSWSHMAFSFDKGLVKVYINGVEKFSGGNLRDFFTGNEGVFALGVNYWNTPFNGLIDEFNVYEASLTADEVKALDIDKLPDSELLASATEILDLGDLTAVKEDLDLPITGPYAASIVWTSSEPTIISETGKVTLPGREETDKQVTLTATLKLAGEMSTKVFTATVKSKAPPTPVAIFSFEDDLKDVSANFGAGNLVGDKIGVEGGSVTFEDGAVGKAVVLDGTSGIELPDNLIKDNTYAVSMWLNPTQLDKYVTALFGYASNTSWTSVLPGGQNDYEKMVVWSGETWFDGKTDYVMPTGEWTHLAYSVNDGNIKIYINGEEKFSGESFPDVFSVPTTKFAIGVNFWDTPFVGAIDELKFYDEAITAEYVVELFNEAQ